MLTGLRALALGLLILNVTAGAYAWAVGADDAAARFALGMFAAAIVVALVELGAGVGRWLDRGPDDWTIHG